MTLRQLWKATELSSHEFANEVASFFGLRRLTHSELAESSSLADRFSRRFLRETQIFPFETGGGKAALAIGDPSDGETLRAAELVFGSPFEIVAASFEDIAALLGDRLDSSDPAADGIQARDVGGAEESVDNLRDLASGAPVVRAVNDLMEKAVELRASDIHIEPFRDGLGGAHAGGRPFAGDAGARSRAAAGARSRASRFSPGSTSPNAACRRTAPRACAWRGPRSTSASPPCRPSTAKPRSSACCRATAACSISRSSGLRRATRKSSDTLLDLPHGMIVGHRPDRQRQDDDACDHALGAQRADRARS